MTTTIMEPYDAQMIDYQNDHDIQMQASSSDPWFQDEATMEDDGNLAYQPKGATADAMPSIEVEMEAYIEDQHIEYDMTDDHHGHNPTPGEPLDVDLLDASRVQSPFATAPSLPSVPSAEFSQPQLTTHPTGAPSTSDLSLSVPPLLSLENAIGSTTFVGSISKVPVTDSSVDAPSTETEQMLAPSPSHAGDAVEHAAETTIPPADEEIPSEHHHSARHSSVASQSTAQAQPVPDGGGIPNSNIFVNDMNRGGSHPLDAVQDPIPSGPSTNIEEIASRDDVSETQKGAEGLEEHVSSAAEQNSHEDATDATFDARNPVTRSASTGHRSTEFVEQTVTHEETQNAEQENYEHIEPSNEVSEEVYLDAPPPILLAIFSIDHPELFLFNPAGPLPNEDGSQERHVLLQQAPTLYYEPVAHVFDALRQDEYVSTVLEVNGNELAFDAYELELAISEDNVYAREISLHDIHILHTSANLAGPLRLRLHIIGPRFIVRYHMLQEGLVHLHGDESQDSDTQEEIGEDQQVRVDHLQDEDVGTDGAVAVDPVRSEAVDHSESHSDEEHEDVEEYHYPVRDEAEETTVHAGEIDLSALPPFVDSPGANEDYEQTEEAEESLPAATVIPDRAATDGRSAAQAVQLEPDGQAEPDAADSAALETAKDNAEPTEEIALEPYIDYDEGTDATATAGTINERPEPQEGFDEVAASEDSQQPHPSDRTEKTLQPEHGDHTNEELPPTAALADINDDGETQEILDEHEQQYVNIQADATANEELKEPEDETWDDELDGEGDPDTTWEAEQDNGDESLSNESSVTLSSKASKRSFDEFGFENSDDEDLASNSPGPKRARVE